jgi:hypothetical protein
MNGRHRKRLGYRDQGDASVEAHAAHWEGFTWTGGPHVVCLYGQWGKPQVWASSVAEGKRVLLHAAAIAGYDPASDPNAEWASWRDSSGRSSTVRTYRVRILPGGYVECSKRNGPAGDPEFAPATQEW